MDRSPGLRVTRAGTAPVLWRGKLGVGQHPRRRRLAPEWT
jgi:hypothetical protein